VLTGEFSVAIDEKGRLLIPAKMRSEIAGNVLMVTKGPDPERCLWLFTPDKWEEFSTKVMKAMSPFSEEDREIYRRVISPCQDLEIDRIGRILIPVSFRNFAHLKKEAVILGAIFFIEIWDADLYAADRREKEERGVYKEAEKKLRERVSF
jgi:MraZ protein